jgi:SAM-dependent methyltransferase
MIEATHLATFLCPACGGHSFETILDIPPVPVNCSVLWPDRNSARAARRAGIQLICCQDCALIFNATFDSKLVEYDGRYDNSLDFSPSFREYCEALTGRLIQSYDLRKKRIAEIGSGKGHFLRLLCEAGANEGIGFDPSHAPETGRVGEGSVTLVQDLFRGDFGGQHPELVCFRHVLEHFDDPADFIRGLREALRGANDSVIYCEVPNAACVFGGASIWDLAYPHVCYFAAPALQRLFASNGFRTLAIGTSCADQYLYIEAALGTDPLTEPRIEKEGTLALAGNFRRRFMKTVAWWGDFLNEALLEGRRLALWGCGARGVTFLNVVPGGGRIEYVCDINPHKQGAFVPGTGQRILSPEALKEAAVDGVVIPNPVYKSEIERSLRNLGISAEVITGLGSQRFVQHGSNSYAHSSGA